MKTVVFDIETSKVTPDGVDIRQCRPLGIACIAAILVDDNWNNPVVHVFHGGALSVSNFPFPTKMETEDVQDFVDRMGILVENDYRIVGWNSAGFDFDILAEECQSPMYIAKCAALARAHYDPAFQMLCQLGYMAGLQKTCEGMGVTGKLEGMHGDMAPIMWGGTDDWEKHVELADLFGCAPGSTAAQQLVIKYVVQDVKATLDVTRAIEQHGFIRWITGKGVPKVMTLADGRLLTVEKCLAMPLPSTKWMSAPRSREEIVGWMMEKEVAKDQGK